MPTASDLVTDLPADFETFGQAVDTTLADLKGGTSGQILAKASNTDMDFTWVTNDVGDITAVTAGTGITGGGTSGAVTVSFDQANFGGGQYAAGKNKIINGDFGIWQRGTSFTASGYTADRFRTVIQNTTTISRQTFTPGTAPVAGYEGQYFLRLARTTSATGDFLTQKIEDVRTFAGQTVTVSFWAKANASVTLSSLYFEQDFGSGGSSAVATTMTPPALTTSWARYSFTVAIPSISGKTVGTSSFLDLVWAFATGMGNCTVDIWGVQVEAGSTATPFQTATGTIQGELSACQRYYYRNTTTEADAQFATGIATSTSQVDFMVAFPVSMRVKPSTAEYGNLEVTDTVTPLVVSTAAIFRATQTTAYFYVSSLSSVTQYRPYFLQANTSAGYIGFSVEL